MTTPVAHDPDPTPPKPTSRVEVRAILLTCLGFVAGIAFMILALHQINPNIFDSEAVTVMPSASEGGSRQGGMGMDIQEVLTNHIPLDIRGSCTAVPAGELDQSTYASARCRLTGPDVDGIEAQYFSLHDALAMHHMFDAKMSLVKSQREPCDGGAELWDFVWRALPPDDEDIGQVVHMPKVIGGPKIEGRTNGEVMCYVNDDGMHEMAWFDNDTHIFATASVGVDFAHRLYMWWESGAGPYHPRGMGSSLPSSPAASGSPSLQSPSSSSSQSASPDPM